MRSSVSYMLSHGPGEPTMSHPDYEQHALHHGCLLVLLRGIGPAKPRSLQKVFEKVRRVNNVKIKDSLGFQRDIWIRYVHDHPVENNDWGDFQTHRRLLGLITIGKFDTQIELNELCRLHESLKVKYTSTLFDSRCILFGPSSTSSSSSNKHTLNRNDINSASIINSSNSDENSIQSIETIDHPLKRLEDEYTTPSNFKSTAFFYNENDACIDLDNHISEFISSLFWILESKRLERSREKVDKVPLLLAPFEKKDFVGLDLESRTSRKRSIGRVTKNLADLTLQAGLIAESLNLFHAASETLRAINDSLWLGAAEEGLCSASAILLYPSLRQTEFFHRNASLQEGSSPQKFNAIEKNRRRSSDILSKKIILENSTLTSTTTTTATATTPLDSQNSAENSVSSNSSSSSSVSSMLTSNSTSSGSSGSTTVTGNAIDMKSNLNNLQNTTVLPFNILQPDEIAVQYRKAIINYSKYRHAAIVETEAALKAARICIEQQKNLDVAMFLQNAMYINLNMTESERVKRFEILTFLYQQIGYNRKAAFCQRLAAWKHVAQGNPNPDWSQSYRLMLESFPGYLLSLDPLEVIENAAGWPMLQIDLLQQLIMAAKRLGHSALATRHMTFLLQTQWENMSFNEQREMAVQLQNLSAQCEGSPVPLVLENGTVIPPANLTDIPFCIQMQVKDLPSHLRPHKIIVTKIDSGPFLFTPIHFSSIDRRVNKKIDNKIAFYWVQNDLSEVTIKLKNTLPFELTVSDMRLLTNGVVFEALPQTIILPPDTPTTITLHGTPIESGQLEIQGYSTHTLGVKSNCRLKHMSRNERVFPQNYLVNIIPALPRLTAKTSLPQSATFSTMSNSDSVITSASLTIYNGEKSSCLITLKNESTIAIEHLEVAMQSNLDNDLLSRIFQLNQNVIQSKLPIQPNETIEFTILIYGEADFLCASNHGVACGSGGGLASSTGGIGGCNNDGSQSLNYSALSSGHASIPSRVSSPTHQYLGRRTDLTSSFRSSNSGGGGLAVLNFPASNSTTIGQHVEAQIRLRYSGGHAMQEGYCRQCAISINLELLPSAQITSWDVLPAETPSQFYLVLDVSNLTAQEMALNYTTNKNILIEAKESCRVPIPVDRCSLEQLTADAEAAAMTKANDTCDNGGILIIPTQGEITEKLCSEHIAERVKLCWMLTGMETKGVASLKGITLSNSMIDLITVAPLQWTVCFNDTLIQPQSEFICSAGQCVALSITVLNQSQTSLHHLSLTIQFYQDYQNSVHNYHLETRLMMSGPNQMVIPVLERNEKIHHECSVIFFTPGRFKANIQCRSLSLPFGVVSNNNDIASTAILQSGNITNSVQQRSSVPNITTTIISADKFFNNYPQYIANSNNNFDETQHVWRFIPAVEVTVVESV